MKKYISVFLAAILAFSVLALAGCGNETENTATEETAVITEETEAAVVGGVETPETNEEISLPDGAQEAFEKATDGTTEEYTVIAYLGSQVVSGTNYAYLCNTAKDGTTSLNVVVVYSDLEGNASVTSSEEINASSYMKNEDVTAEQTDGGWTFTDAYGCGLGDEEQAAFDKISADNAGYTPIALLGSQVVSGMNYVILCKTAAGSDEATALAAMTIYADLSGNAEVTYICPFDF